MKGSHRPSLMELYAHPDPRGQVAGNITRWVPGLVRPLASPAVQHPSRRVGVRLPAVLSVLLLCFLIGACYTGPNTDHFEGVLNELRLPADWEAVQAERRGPGEVSDCDPMVSIECPEVRRWYLVRDDASTALDQIRQAMTAAGFAKQDVKLPKCDGVPQANVCSVFAERGNDRLAASIYLSAEAAGIDAPSGQQVIVRISASR